MAIPLAYFLVLQARSCWRNYWLMKDGQEGMAVVIKKHWGGHGAVVYKYVVNQKQYMGTSSRNWQDARYSNVQAGDDSVVYFSASHPWLSLLYRPRTTVEGLPVVIVALVLEFFVVMTALNSKSKWALDFRDRKECNAASYEGL